MSLPVSSLKPKSGPKHIQATWTDLSNITRCQLTTKELYDSHFKKAGFSNPYFILSLPYMNQMPLERVTGEVTFRPDEEIPRPLPWLEDAAFVFGQFFDGEKPWNCCPRSFLIAQERKMQKLGLKLRLGFEMEFYLLNLDGSPVDGASWTVITSAIAAMQQLEIPVWKYHAEAGKGQFELSIGPFHGSALKTADSLVLARQAISHVAASHGLRATFLPQPFEAAPGSSVHTNISLWNLDDENLFKVNAQQSNSFLAGLFKQLPNLMPILCPIGNSYARLQPFNYSGTFHCMGTENRKAAIRIFFDGSVVTRLEVRCVDGGSNPYLLLGSLIGAGLDGIDKGHELPPLVEVDPATLPEGIRPRRLPTSLEAAIQEFTASPFIKELYGAELFNLILRIRKVEEAHWSSDKESQESKIKDLLDKY